EGWGTLIRSTCPVIVETVRAQYPELIPYLAPVATPIAAEARYLKQMYGPETPVVYAGACITEGGNDVDAAITFAELAGVLKRRGIEVEKQAAYFSRLPEERRRHWSMAGGLPREVLLEETQASRRFRKVRGMGNLEAIARAVAVDRIDLGFVDASCRAFATAAALGRTTLKSCPPYLDKVARQAQLQAAVDGLTGLATYRVLRDRLATEVARSDRTGDAFAVLFVDLDNFKQV